MSNCACPSRFAQQRKANSEQKRKIEEEEDGFTEDEEESEYTEDESDGDQEVHEKVTAHVARKVPSNNPIAKWFQTMLLNGSMCVNSTCT